ncbi:hypothetical protein HPULCUR_006694 [Helicostylum pulchrum]|uniref:Golgi apparatus membrane protein TVP18 n=1 Tax=Helicostylum pulchrum TaxID=562976 RepID=A0ABP9Y2P2_9FUNG
MNVDGAGNMCTERIETYAETLAIERTKAIDIDPSDTSDIELDTIDDLEIEQRRRAIEKEEEVVESTDLSRKRLAVLRSILRQVILKYHGQHITEAEIRDISNTTYTQEEIRVLSSIANFLMPYIPIKQTWYTTAYQIPFILMSNDIMRYTGRLGIISIILLIALGIVGFTGHVIFSIVGWVIAFLLVLVEIPLCIKVCPTSPKLDSFIAYFENCYFRAILYLVFAVVMFLSNLKGTGPLIACGVSLLLGSICYGFAAFKGQAFASSK